MAATLELVVDGASHQVDPEESPHVAAAARPWLCGRDGSVRVVTSLRIDACCVAADRLANLEAIPLAGARRVEIETESAMQVARSGLESASEYAGRLAGCLCAASAQLRAGRVEEGTLSLAEAVDGLSVLCFTVDAGRRTLGEAAGPLEGFSSGLEPWLSAVADAHEKADWVRVADYLEYEVARRVEALPHTIAALSDEFVESR